MPESRRKYRFILASHSEMLPLTATYSPRLGTRSITTRLPVYLRQQHTAHTTPVVPNPIRAIANNQPQWGQALAVAGVGATCRFNADSVVNIFVLACGSVITAAKYTYLVRNCTSQIFNKNKRRIFKFLSEYSLIIFQTFYGHYARIFNIKMSHNLSDYCIS